MVRPGKLACVLLLLLICPRASADLVQMADFEGGALGRTGKLKVLRLRGSCRQMGRQYGRLLAREMRGMAAEIRRQYAANQVKLEALSRRLLALYPRRFLEIAEGMKETSRMSLEEIALLNGFFDYHLARSDGACSAISVWGPYTGGKALVMGRNFDFPATYRAFSPYLVLVVYRPTDGSYPAAVLAHAGMIGGIQAFNQAGIVLENNNGAASASPHRAFAERTPFMIKQLELALDYGSLESLDGAMKGNRYHYPLIFNVASPVAAYCYETTTSEVKRRGAEREGLLIGVNHFLHPDWGEARPAMAEGVKYSMTRHRNLAALAEKAKGRIDARKMMELLNVPLESGGAKPSDKSIYQFVFVPARLELWVKAEGHLDWTPVELKGAFQSPRVVPCAPAN